jgi:raffinose/stachyose/melibiose transport system permease protein
MARSVTTTADRSAVPSLPAVAGGDGTRKRRRHHRPPGLGWILPAFVLSAGLIYFCVAYVGYISLLPWNWSLGEATVVKGLESYARILDDRIFWLSLRHTLVFFVGSYVLLVVMGLILAAMLHSRVYLSTFFKIVVFVPAVIAPAIMAPVHRRVFAADGSINAILEQLGLLVVTPTGSRVWADWVSTLLTAVGLSEVTPNWIQPATSLWVIVGAQVFGAVGIAFILFYAAMGQIEPEVLEAARVDGANNLRVLWSIIVPAMRPTLISIAILHAITSLKLFEYPYLITEGGPANSSEFLGTHIYNQMFGISNNFGYASALSVILFLLALTVSIVVSTSARERSPRRRRRLAIVRSKHV